MKSERIEIGDIVNISFHASHFTLCNKAEVLWVPHNTGEHWRFRVIDGNGNAESGTIISSDERMTLIKLESEAK